MKHAKNYQSILPINFLDQHIKSILVKHPHIKSTLLSFYYDSQSKNIYSNLFMSKNKSSPHTLEVLIDYSSNENQKKFKVAADLEDWTSIYKHTKFLINSGKEQVWFSFQFLPKDKRHLARTFAIISAANPNMQEQDKKTNQQSHHTMTEILTALNKEFYSSRGELCGYEEESFIIYDIDKNEAMKLGQEFDQESIVFNTGNSIGIYKCSTNEDILLYVYENNPY